MMHDMSTSRNDFNVLFDAVCQVNERLRVVRTLQKQRAAKLHNFEKNWMDSVIDTGNAAIAVIARVGEPLLEPIDSRGQRLHGTSLPLLLRLKGLIIDSSQTTRHFAQLSIVAESLDIAMDVLATCEVRNPTAATSESSSYELCEFINHRRLANTDRQLPMINEPPGPVATITLSDISGRNHRYTNPPSISQSSNTTNASTTAAGRFSQRDSIEVMNHVQTCRAASHARRTGWALERGTCSEPAMSVMGQQLKYDLPLVIEEAGIWRQLTESAFNVATQDTTYRDRCTLDRIYRSRLCTCKGHDRFESPAGSSTCEQKEGSSREPIDVQEKYINAVTTGFDDVPKCRLTVAGLQTPTFTQQAGLGQHVQKEWPRRRSLPTMMCLSSSPQFPSSALPSGDCCRHSYGAAIYNSDIYCQEDATIAASFSSSSRYSDKEVVSSRAPTLITTPSNTSAQSISLRNESSISLVTNASEIGSKATANELAPSHRVTRGRALLEYRAESQP
jgi:hypothetical protein